MLLNPEAHSKIFLQKGLFQRADLKTPSETALFLKQYPGDAQFQIKENLEKKIY